jgi:Ca-activated chloride channel family protein
MTAALVSLFVFVLVLLAESFHFRRVRRLAALAFDEQEKSGRRLALAALGVRTVAAAALAWGLVTLLSVEAKSGQSKKAPKDGFRHIILLLDVSPSMRLKDAGASGQKMRNEQAKEVVMSIFERIALDQARVSVIALYTGAKQVVQDTADLNVVRNVLDDLPLRWAFEPGKTNIFAGLNEAAALAKPWNPDSATVFLISDGDTVPDTGMPAMPKSIAQVVVIGVGSATGKFIDGHQSRQDSNTLRQVASRLGGTYFDANVRNVPSGEIASLAEALPMKDIEGFGLREAALACVIGAAAVLAAVSLFLALSVSRMARLRSAAEEVGTPLRTRT